MALFFFLGLAILSIASVASLTIDNHSPIIWAFAGATFIIYDGLQEIKEAIR